MERANPRHATQAQPEGQGDDDALDAFNTFIRTRVAKTLDSLQKSREHVIYLMVFAIAAITDFVDGLLARRWGGRNVRVDEDSIAALRTFGIGRGVVEALRPTAGRGDIDLYLKDPARPGGIAEMDLALRECAMTYQGFGAKDNRIGKDAIDLQGRWVSRGTTMQDLYDASSTIRRLDVSAQMGMVFGTAI